MSVQTQRGSDSRFGLWEWTCLFGCYGYDYTSEEDARLGYLEHDCEVWR